MSSKKEKAEIKRRFEEEWEKNWWARYALTHRKPDGTPEDHAKEDVMIWNFRDWMEYGQGLRDLEGILFNMSTNERDATNYLCGRIDGDTLIQYDPGVNWEVSRAQNPKHDGLEIDHGDTDSDVSQFETKIDMLAFSYGKDPFSQVSDIDYAKRWGGLHGFMLAFGINPQDSDAIVRAGQLITALRKQGAIFSSPHLEVKSVKVTWKRSPVP